MKDYEYRDENGNYLDYYTILEDNKKMTKELEELEELSKMCNKSTSDCIELAKQLKEAQERIDKAIKYIENLQQSNEKLQRDYNKTIDFGIYETDNLLSILRGEE